MDVAHDAVNRSDVVGCRSFARSEMAAAAMVDYWNCGRINRASRTSAKSHKCKHDLLAAGIAVERKELLRDLLLSRKRRRVSQFSLAAHCGASNSRISKSESDGHAPLMVELIGNRDCCGRIQHLAHGAFRSGIVRRRFGDDIRAQNPT